MQERFEPRVRVRVRGRVEELFVHRPGDRTPVDCVCDFEKVLRVRVSVISVRVRVRSRFRVSV